MRIGIDVSLAVGEIAGVGRYSAELVTALSEIDQQNQYLLFPLFLFIRHPAFRSYSGPKQPNFKLWGAGLSDREAFEFWKNPKWVRRVLTDCDIVHCTTFCVPPFPHPGVVSTIYDLTFITHPGCHTEANRVHCLEGTIDAVLKAARVIAISEHTREELKRYLNSSPKRTLAIPLAASNRFFQRRAEREIEQVKKRYGIDSPYVLSIGSLEPRKNLPKLIDAWGMLPESLRRTVKLVLAGGSGWLNSPLEAQIERLGLADSVSILGYVEDEELPCLYQGALLFVYPSLAEGFGLPVVEAMASGAPVVTSRNSSLQEIAEGAAILVDPLDASRISEGIQSLLESTSTRAELTELGLKRARTFSWRSVAERTLQVYREVERE